MSPRPPHRLPANRDSRITKTTGRDQLTDPSMTAGSGPFARAGQIRGDVQDRPAGVAEGRSDVDAAPLTVSEAQITGRTA